MWVMTIFGFYSIACADRPGGGGEIDPDTVMVRARMKEHLVNLKERFPLSAYKIEKNPDTDYRFRLIMPKAVWVQVLLAMAEEQTWSNFKKEAGSFERAHNQPRKYLDALHKIWNVMWDVQERQHGKD